MGKAYKIRVRYSTADGLREARRYMSVRGAQAFAHKYVGAHPDLGSHYAVSSDGIGIISVEGCSLAELFPSGAEPEFDYAAAERAHHEAEAAANREAYEAQAAEFDRLYRPHRAAGCSCSDQQLVLVGCDCAASYPF